MPVLHAFILHDDGVGFPGPAEEPLGNAVPVADVTVAGQDDQFVVGVGFKKPKGPVGHAFIPQHLGLEKVIEFIDAGLVAVQVEHGLQFIPVGCVGKIEFSGQPGFLLCIQAFQTLAGPPVC